MQKRTRVVMSAVVVAALALPAPAIAKTTPSTTTFIAKRPAEALLDENNHTEVPLLTYHEVRHEAANTPEAVIWS